MRDFPTFHRVHAHFFGDAAPTLTVIEVGEVGHKGTLIEIEPTAVLPGKGLTRRSVNAAGWKAPACMSMLVEAGGLAFLSGITAGKGGSGKRTARAQVASEANAIVAELKARLALVRAGLDRVAHLTVFVDDITAFTAVAPVLERAFGKRRPALAVMEVPQPAPPAVARMQITAIAWLGEGETERS
jgi:enamine deaminase RidA (YjgF/YER057c/UK114 family)